MLKLSNGNMFGSQANVLVNPVNCLGTHGAGLAKVFKQKWPKAAAAHTAECKKGMISPGVLFWRSVEWEGNEHGRVLIVFFPTKIQWQQPSQLQWIEDGLRSFRQFLGGMDRKRVAIPALGCGLGGLEFGQVNELVNRFLGKTPHDIELFLPS